MTDIPEEAIKAARSVEIVDWLAEPLHLTEDEARDVLIAAAPTIRADERQRIIAEIQASDLGAPVKLDPYSGTAHFLTGSELRERICAFIAKRSGE